MQNKYNVYFVFTMYRGMRNEENIQLFFFFAAIFSFRSVYQIIRMALCTNHSAQILFSIYFYVDHDDLEWDVWGKK